MIKDLKSFGKSNISYIKYKNLDHTFHNKKGKSELTRVINSMKIWINNKIKEY